MKISKSKREQLYSAIHNDVMDARVRINMLLEGNPNQEPIDKILYDLMTRCPIKAISLFEVQEKKDGTKKEYPEYKQFVDLWCKKFPLIGVKMPMDGKKIKSIIDQTKDIINDGSDPVAFWKIFLDNLHRTWADNSDLKTIESKYRSLIAIISQNRPKNKDVRGSAKDYINSL